MVLSLSGVVAAVEGQLGRSQDPSADTDDEADPSSPEASRSTLFQCPDCESVYVAMDKQICATCDSPVEEVPSTLSRS